MPTYSIESYKTEQGKKPFYKWLKLLDENDRKRIHTRMSKIRSGVIGDYKKLKGGICEVRFSFSPGYRIYFCYTTKTNILILCAGSKKTQSKDILKARKYFQDYKKRGDHNVSCISTPGTDSSRIFEDSP